MTDLTTLAAVRNQLRSNALNPMGTEDDSLISDYVTQASAWIESEVGFPIVGQGGGTRTYDACPPDVYGRKLFLGDFFSGIDRIVNGDGIDVATDEYRLLPPNTTPKYAVELKPSGGVSWAYTGDRLDAITVYGTLGYTAGTADIPADLTLAATRLASWLYQTRDSTGDIKVAEGFTVIPANAPALVLRTIANYQRLKVYP
jgi:hypothetical protein